MTQMTAPAAAPTVPVTAGIRLQSGGLFDYDAPHEADVHIEDVAFPLARICRFAGQLPSHVEFYSVAQHAVNCSRIVSKEHAFTALMHDTAEAFTNDITTPLKRAIPDFARIEQAIESDMARRFGFQYPLPDEVKRADLQMLALEKKYLKEDHSHWEVLDGIDVEGMRHMVDFDTWMPRKAAKIWMARYEELRG